VQGIEEDVARWTRQQARSGVAGPGESPLYQRFLELFEPPLLRAVLERCGGNRAAAAQILGIHRATLREKLRRYDID
jgi:DNA-binding protein Fis